MTSTSALNAATNNSNKCLVYGTGGIVQTSVSTAPQQIPSNHILVQVHAVGLNPVDAKHKIGDKFPSFLNSFSQRLVKGLTIGFEFSGTVAGTNDNDNDNDYKIGDEVFGSMPPLSGTLSEYIVAPNHQVCRKPSTLSFAEAACVPLVGLTAVQALQPYAASGSTSIAIVGASGGAGHMALQVAKELGFTTRIAICSTANMAFCTSLGATHVIDYTRNQVVADLAEHVGGGSVDIILDCVTSVEARDAKHGYSQKLLPLCNTKYIRLGGPTIGWFYAGCERLLHIPCFWGKDKLFWIRFPKSSDELALLAKWCSGKGGLKPHISTPSIDFSAEAVQQAFDAILGRHVKGKLVVEIIKTADDPAVVAG